MGFIIFPPVKNLLMSSPRSAIRAICSAPIGFFFLSVFFIKVYFFPRSFPKRYEMVELSLLVSTNFVNQRIHSLFYPARGAELLRVLAAVAQKVAMAKDLLRLGKSDSALPVRLQLPILASVKVEPETGITLIPHSMPPIPHASLAWVRKSTA